MQMIKLTIMYIYNVFHHPLMCVHSICQHLENFSAGKYLPGSMFVEKVEETVLVYLTIYTTFCMNKLYKIWHCLVACRNLCVIFANQTRRHASRVFFTLNPIAHGILFVGRGRVFGGVIAGGSVFASRQTSIFRLKDTLFTLACLTVQFESESKSCTCYGVCHNSNKISMGWILRWVA